MNCSVDCVDVTAADCSGGHVLLADPSIGRCCDICGETASKLENKFYYVLVS